MKNLTKEKVIRHHAMPPSTKILIESSRRPLDMFPADLRMSSTIKILLGFRHFAARIMKMQISQDMPDRPIFRDHRTSLSRSEGSAVGEEG